MPAVPAAVPLACPGCTRLFLLRHYPRLSLFPIANRQTRLSTSSTSPLPGAKSTPRKRKRKKLARAEPALEEKASPNNGTPPMLRPHVWTSMLDRQTLGAASSVLVLRDAERKKQRRISSHQQHQRQNADQAATVEKILSSIKSGNHDTAQDDVQQSISSLRPADAKLSDTRPPCISKARFKDTLGTLSDGFSQIQLARYITKTGSAAALPPSPLGTEKDGILRMSDWISAEPVSKVKPTQIYRGKGALANNIIRSVWGFEVLEEVEIMGTMEVQIDPKLLSFFLFGDDTSVLSQLSKTRGVQIDVIRSTGTLLLAADKYKCLEVARDIDRRLRDVYKSELDIRFFHSLNPRRSPKLIVENFAPIAKTCSCTLEQGSNSNKIIIRGSSQADTERCQRAIVATHFNIFNQPDETVILHGGAPVESFLSGAPPGLKSLPFAHRDIPLGRFWTAFATAKAREAWSTGNLKIPRDILNEEVKSGICERLFEILKAGVPSMQHQDLNAAPVNEGSEEPKGTHWHTVVYSEMFAEPGHVLHHMPGPGMMQPITAEDLPRGGARPAFAPAMSGLPQFLLTNASNSDSARADSLLVFLIPSPWALRNLSDQRAYPPLELRFQPDFNSGIVKFRSLRMFLRQQVVNVLLPSLGTDVRFESRNFLKCSRAEEIPEVADFLKEIQDTAHGYGKARPPITLDLDIPTWAVRKRDQKPATSNANKEVGGPKIATRNANKKGGGTTRVQYFATGIQYEESLMLDFKGSKLAIRQIDGGEHGVAYQGLRLHYPSATRVLPTTTTTTAAKETIPETGRETQQHAEPSSSSSPSPSSPSSESKSTVRTFIDTTSSLLRELNLALGNMRMMDVSPDFADARRVNQRHQGIRNVKLKRLRLDRGG